MKEEDYLFGRKSRGEQINDGIREAEEIQRNLRWDVLDLEELDNE